jgi:uncharacterized membrane protein
VKDRPEPVAAVAVVAVVATRIGTLAAVAKTIGMTDRPPSKPVDSP